MRIVARQLGQKRSLYDEFSVPPPHDPRDGDRLRLRDIIAHVVRSEVAKFKDRVAARQFDRVLSARKIDDGRAQGKIDPAAQKKPQHVDSDEAVANALLAFEDGIYLVIIDEIERRDLDELIFLRDDSQLVFVRLTFLAGA